MRSLIRLIATAKTSLPMAVVIAAVALALAGILASFIRQKPFYGLVAFVAMLLFLAFMVP